MQKKFRLVLSAALCCLLTACLIPQKFEATVHVNPDNTYQYTYERTALYSLAAMALAQQGHLSSQDEASLKTDVNKANRPGEHYTYLGNGQIEVSLNEKLRIGQHEPMELIFSGKDKNGVITIASVEVQPQDKEQLRQLHVKVNVRLKSRYRPAHRSSLITPTARPDFLTIPIRGRLVT